MNRNQINKYLSQIDADLFVSKADGVWYLLGGDDDVYNPFIERCLHVVRLSDLNEATLEWKIQELTK